MAIINTDDLTFEVFDFGEGEEHKFVNYISEEALLKAPQIELVKHARWVYDIYPCYGEDGKLSVRSICSHCGYLDHVDFIPAELWEMGYKNTYKPELHAYCAKCGRKMDEVVEEEVNVP